MAQAIEDFQARIRPQFERVDEINLQIAQAASRLAEAPDVEKPQRQQDLDALVAAAAALAALALSELDAWRRFHRERPIPADTQLRVGATVARTNGTYSGQIRTQLGQIGLAQPRTPNTPGQVARRSRTLLDALQRDLQAGIDRLAKDLEQTATASKPLTGLSRAIVDIRRRTLKRGANSGRQAALSQAYELEREWHVANGITRAVWWTQADERVRPDHVRRHRTIYDTRTGSAGLYPGEAPNCRCWAEPLPPGSDEPVTDLT